MLKFLLLTCILFFSNPSSAGVIKVALLTSFADQFSYQDNRKTLSRDKIYSASKKEGGSSPSAVIEAYPGRKDFKQVALWCDHCGVRRPSDGQIKLCKQEFRHLYQALLGEEASEKLISKIGSENVPDQHSTANYRLRFSNGALKCDGKGGVRVRIDFYTH